MNLTSTLILASASPRRRELMAFLGVPYEVIPSQAEETATGTGREHVAAIAKAKCQEVADRYPDRYPDRYVLAADTLVCVDDAILGKPKDAADAARMLEMLSGRWHEVHTGICLMGPKGLEDIRVETTRVEFASLTPQRIAAYVRTGEPMDKAGAYAIQGISGMFITRIEGSPTNVIGLPLAAVSDMLERAGFQLLPSKA